MRHSLTNIKPDGTASAGIVIAISVSLASRPLDMYLPLSGVAPRNDAFTGLLLYQSVHLIMVV